MKILIDADACPVVDIAVKLCREFHIHCTLLCDTAHTIHREGADTLVFDKGADSVDFALVNRVCPGDIVITQDYGLASMCLARQAKVLHQDGWHIPKTIFKRCYGAVTRPVNTANPAGGPKVLPKEQPNRARTLPTPSETFFSKLSRDKLPAVL